LKEIKIIVDTSFLLPILGIEVEEVSNDDLVFLKKIVNKVTLLYPSPMLIELIGKAVKKAKERGLSSLPTEAVEGLKIIFSGVFIEIINPDFDSLILASRIWLHGHKDMLDNIAYSCSRSLNAFFLTLDRDFVNFLKEKNYPTDNIVDIAGLRKILSNLYKIVN